MKDKKQYLELLKYKGIITNCSEGYFIDMNINQLEVIFSNIEDMIDNAIINNFRYTKNNDSAYGIIDDFAIRVSTHNRTHNSKAKARKNTNYIQNPMCYKVEKQEHIQRMIVKLVKQRIKGDE